MTQPLFDDNEPASAPDVQTGAGQSACSAADSLLLNTTSPYVASLVAASAVLFWIMILYVKSVWAWHVYQDNPGATLVEMTQTSETLAACASAGLYVSILWILRISPANAGLSCRNVIRDLTWGVVCAGIAWLFQCACLYTELSIRAGVSGERVVDLARRSMSTWHALLLREPDVSALVWTLSFGVLAEETIFRGIVLLFVRRATGCWTTAIVVSSITHAGCHVTMGWRPALMAILPSAVFATAFVVRRSLITAVSAHWAFNMSVVAIRVFLR